MDKKKMIGGMLIAGIAGLAVGGATVGFTMEPNTIVQEKIVEIEKQVPVEVPVEVVKEVQVTKEVMVDNEKLDEVLEHIYDNEGDVEYLLDDLDNDELAMIVDRVAFVNEIKTLAIAEAKGEIADLVDKEVVNTNELDEDDVERVRVDDDHDEVIVEDIDFEDQDAELTVTGTFEHDDIDYEWEVLVEFKEGEVDDIELISVAEE